MLQSLTNAYLDLAIALPYPPTWPVYSCTIVLAGVTSRVALLPVVFWVNQVYFMKANDSLKATMFQARMRERRVAEDVIPYLNVYRTRLEERAQQQLAETDNEAARDYYNHIISEKVNEELSDCCIYSQF